jgi:hypothetical protein
VTQQLSIFFGRRKLLVKFFSRFSTHPECGAR